MKIFIPHKEKPSTGKGFFCSRLFEELKKYEEVKLIIDPMKKHDISLHNIKLDKIKTNSIFKIIRLDGVIYNKNLNHKKQNKDIAKNLHKSDGVVYQSNFSKKVCDKFLGKFDGVKSIIYNGASPEYYKNISLSNVIFKHVFVSFARWRPHKRLKDIIESFLLASIENSCLIIGGDISKSGLSREEIKMYFSKFNIKYVKKLSQKQMASYLKIATAFIHLCWIDNCPNSVVEAICSETTVISNNISGTPEIVKPSNGIIVNIDDEYSFKPCELYKPPKIDRRMVANAIINSIDYNKKVNYSIVDIKNITKQYLKFFKKVMNKNERL